MSYDSSTNGWTTLVMPYKLASMSATVINNQIFYAGGYDPATYAVSDVVQIYDIASNTWLYPESVRGSGPGSPSGVQQCKSFCWRTLQK